MFLTRLLKNTPKLIQSTLWSWGNNQRGTAGDGAAASSGLVASRSSPVQIGSESWKMTAGTTYATAGIKSDGTLWTWGSGNNGNLGTNDSYDSVYNAKQVEVGTSFIIVAGRTGTAAIDSTGKLWVWGINANGRLGTNDVVTRSNPTQIMADKSFTAVAMDFTGLGAIDDTGGLWVTGAYNKFTNNKSTDAYATRSSPALVGGLLTKTSSLLTHTLQLDEYGRIWSWGSNAAGELGNLSITAASSPVVVSTPVSVSFSQVSAGQSFSLGLATNGVVYAWGLGTSGQLGNGGILSTSSPVITLSGKSCVMISAGLLHSAAIDTLGQLWTWGTNTGGQLGNNAAVSTSSPVQVTGSWTHVSVGRNFSGTTYGIKSDGTAWAWGNNTYGVLGFTDGSTTSRSSPVQIGTDTDWSSFSGGAAGAFGIKSTGALYGWGSGYYGSGGNNATDGWATGLNANAWIQLPGFQPRSVVTITSHNSGSHHAAIDSTGAMWVWGSNTNGRLGLNTAEAGYMSPTQLGLSSWIAVKATLSGFVAVDAAYRMFFWGGTSTTSSGLPDPLFSGDTSATGIIRSSPTQIGLGIYNNTTWGYQLNSSLNGGALIDATDRGLWTWGINAAGQLGRNNTAASSFNLIKVGAGSWSVVSMVNDSAAAIDSLGQLWTWGFGTGGLIGDNTVVSKSSPVQIMVGKSFTFVTGGTAGGYATGSTTRAAIDTLGQLWMWGLGTAGQMGDSTAVTKSSPIQVKAGTSFSQVAVAQSNVYAIDSLGKLWAWGVNTNGSIGDNTVVSKSSPVQILAVSSFSAVAGGANFALAITTNGVLYGWGLNSGGQLGDSTVVTKSSPTLLHSGTSYTVVRVNTTSGGGAHTLAKTSANAWRAWGLNTTGQLGDATIITKSSPVAIASAMFYGDITTTSTAPTDMYAAAVGTWAYNDRGDLYWTGAAHTGLESLIWRGAATAGLWQYVGPSKRSWTALDATDNNSVALDSTGALAIGGANAGGQLGVQNVLTTLNASMRRQTAGGTFSSVALGDQTTYAIDSLGKLWVWGLGTAGQLGDSTIVSKSSPVQIQVGSSFTLVSSKGTTAYAIMSNGNIKAWGLGTSGQIGNNAALNTSAPTLVTTGASSGSFTQLAAGQTAALAIDTLGKAFGWGLGGASTYSADGVGVNRSAPTQINSTSSFNAVYSVSGPGNQSWGFVRATDGSLWGMGANSVGVNPLLLTTVSPAQIGSNSWSAVSASAPSPASALPYNGQAYGITSDGKLFGWGYNAVSGALGVGDTTNRSSPTQIMAGSSFSAVSTGQGGAATIRSVFGDVWSWGISTLVPANHAGANTSYPIIALGGRYSWSAISVGISNFAGVTSEGRMFVWGDNTNGLLTQGTTSPQVATGLASAIQISQPCALGLIPGTWSDIKLNYYTTIQWALAKSSIGKAWAWGVNTGGTIGDNTIISKSSPVAILAASSITAIATSGQGGALVDTAGKLWAWGGSNAYSVGDGTAVAKSSPVQIGAHSFVKVASSSNHSIALMSDGKLYAWGLGTSGQIGNNAALSTSSPVQVMAGSSFTAVGVAAVNSYAIDINGRLFAWGATGGGNGDNTNVARSSPVLVSTSLSFTFISSSPGYNSQDAVYAITTAGDVQTFGGITYLTGDAGAARSSPVSVSALAGKSVVLIGSSKGGSWYIDNVGALWVWGGQTFGEFGLSDTVTRSSPVQITWGGNSSWSAAVNSGQNNFYAIDSLGRVWGAGVNTGGQLGRTDTVSRSSPVQLDSSFSGYTFLTAFDGGNASTAVIWGTSTGVLRGVGQNGFACLADNTTASKSSPVAMNGGAPAAGGFRYAVSAKAQLIDSFSSTYPHGLWTWGLGTSGQLGDNTIVSKSSPVQVTVVTTAFRSFTQVYSGAFYHLAALESNGTLWGWGRALGGNLGQIGYQNTTTTVPWPVSLGQTVTGSNVVGVTVSPKSIALEVGADTVVGVGGATRIVDSLGRLVVLGVNDNAQFGMRIVNSPVQIGSTTDWSSVSGGDQHFLATKTDGSLYGWGYNVAGNLGDGTVVTRSSPVLISSSSFTAVAAGISHSAAIRADGTLYTWGFGTSGELGSNAAASRSSPAAIATTPAVTIGNTTSNNLSLDQYGNLFGNGINTSGELGDGTIANRSKAALLHSGKSYVAINSVYYGPMNGAIDYLGRLWAWGVNTSGQLGNGLAVSTSSPVSVAGSWSVVAHGASHTVGIKSDGTLWTWGTSTAGVLGDVPSSGTLRSSPAQIGYKSSDSTSWVALAFTKVNQHAAIKSDGTLWMWGLGTSGQLGDNATVSRSSPVQIVGPAGNWESVSVSTQANYTLAIKSDGRLFAWGIGTSGQLGDATLVTKSSPVAIKAGTSFVMTAAGHTNSYAIDNVGQLWSWGRAGPNSGATATSSPVQISGGGSWTYVAASEVSPVTVAAGIQTDGKIYTWGPSGAAFLGTNIATAGTSTPTTVTGDAASSSFTIVSLGASHAVAIDVAGKLWTWGINTSGQLGDGTTNNRSQPTLISSESWAVAKAIGDNTWAVKGNVLYGWGLGYTATSEAGVGDGYQGSRSSPAVVNGVSGPTSMAALTYAGLIDPAAKSIVKMWGPTTNGRYGDSLRFTTTTRMAPIDNLPLAWYSYTLIGAGFDNSAAVRSDGTLWVWGLNTSGINSTTGRGTYVPLAQYSSPNQMLGTTGLSFTAISLGNAGAYTLSDGRIMMTGPALLRGLGLSTTDDYYATSGTLLTSPVIIGTKSWKYLNTSGSENVMFGIDSVYRLWAWGGDSQYGLHARGAFDPLDSMGTPDPRQIDGSWIAIAGDNTKYGIKTDGTLWVWGLGTSGQIGDGAQYSRSSPVQIAGSWVSVKSENTFAVGIKTDGTIWSWGTGSQGSLGQNTTATVNSPTQFLVGSSFTIVSAGFSFAAAVDINGGLWTWGNASNGEIGDGQTLTNRSSPVQIPGSWTSIECGPFTAFGIRTDNTLWTWGYNVYFNRGGASATSSPSQIGTGIAWKSIYARSQSVKALTQDGELFTWGYGSQTNFNNVSAVYSTPQIAGFTRSYKLTGADPVLRGAALNGATYDAYIDNDGYLWGVQVGGFPTVFGKGFISAAANNGPTFLSPASGTSWTKVLSNYSTVSALNSAGTLFGWGLNTSGNMGLNEATNRSSPVFLSNRFINFGMATNVIYGLDALGNIYGSGTNTSGELGDGTAIGRSSPVVVWTGSSKFRKVAAGVGQTVAIDTVGNLVTWGINTTGQVGDNTVVNRSLPTLINTTVQTGAALYAEQLKFIDVAAGGQLSMAIDYKGRAYAWGNNASYNFSSTNIDRSQPTLVSAGYANANFIQVAVIGGSATATAMPGAALIDSNHALWIWPAAQTDGSTGDGTVVARSNPVQVAGSWNFVGSHNARTVIAGRVV
jgi:alpha-tubulin suppressor-like RCC1 family protein